MSRSEAITVGDLLRIGEAAQLLNLRPSTVRAWIQQRKIGYVKLSARAVRLRRADIERLIARGSVAARPE